MALCCWCAFSRKFDVARKYYDRILEDNPTAHDWLNAGHVELCLRRIKKQYSTIDHRWKKRVVLKTPTDAGVMRMNYKRLG